MADMFCRIVGDTQTKPRATNGGVEEKTGWLEEAEAETRSSSMTRIEGSIKLKTCRAARWGWTGGKGKNQAQMVHRAGTGWTHWQ